MKLLKQLEGVKDRSARFVCALAFVRHASDPTPVVSVGYWSGEILKKPKGEQGFGYDPLFYIEQQGCTSAELSSQEKNKISHRAQAMRRLFKSLKQQGVV